MNKHLLTGIAAALAISLAGGPLFAADVKPESAQQAGGTYADVSSYTVEKKEQALTWLSGRIEALDRKMDEVDHSVAGVGEASSAKWDDVKRDLAIKRDNAAKELAEMKKATAESWVDLRDSAVQNMQKLENSFDAAKEEYNK